MDALRDPLLHLVRNAVDHGIEAPDTRRAAGKPTAGRIAARVEPRGTRVVIVVEDDGPGLDVAALRAAAVRNGLLTGEQANRLGDREAARLVFQAASPRARGLGDLRSRCRHGRRARDGRAAPGDGRRPLGAGRGTRFDLELPLMLSASTALLLRAGRDVVVIPAEEVEHVVLLGDADLGTIAGRTTARVAGEHVPYVLLGRLLRIAEGAGAPARHRVALVLAQGGARVAVGVDELIGQQEVVVSALGARAAQVEHLAGAAVLDDGRLVAVLSAAELVRRAQPGWRRRRVATAGGASSSPTTRSPPAPR